MSTASGKQCRQDKQGFHKYQPPPTPSLGRVLGCHFVTWTAGSRGVCLFVFIDLARCISTKI